jgi:DNA-binding NarL/FixJ family response regulator
MAPNTAASRVLILDDNPAFVAAASRFLERMPGYTRAVADVVLVDLGLAGLELARRVKHGNPSLAVIAMALFPTPELVAEAQRLGIDGVISKEGFAQELPEALARAGDAF